MVKKIKETDQSGEINKLKFIEEIKKLKDRIGFLQNHKQKLFEYILE